MSGINICQNCGHDEPKCTPDETYRRAKELTEKLLGSSIWLRSARVPTASALLL